MIKKEFTLKGSIFPKQELILVVTSILTLEEMKQIEIKIERYLMIIGIVIIMTTIL